MCLISIRLIAAEPLNLVLITADDMNGDSMGCTGSRVLNITPNIDRLASEGILFHEAHAAVPVCQPVRATMSTGMYSFHSGCRGFGPIDDGVKTFNEVLHDQGYLISMLAKNPHYEPMEKWFVDYEVLADELLTGRSPEKFAEHTRRFIQMAKEQGKPFFHHVNAQDPHRPFWWRGDGGGDRSEYPPVSREIKPEEVEVPGFLEDIPAVRQEVADYYTCVHRFDEVVGAVMRELEAAGVADHTLVMFYAGDHGMAFPFAKSNVYAAGSRGGLILRWPGVIPSGQVDDEHLLSTIDFAPTLLEAAEAPPLEGIDGRSFLAIAKGENQAGWDHVFTVYHETFAKRLLETRCVRTKDTAFIWNAWSDGNMTYRAENMAGATWKAMRQQAKDDPAMRKRTNFYLYRTPEEFYVTGADEWERHNRVNDPAFAFEIRRLQSMLVKWMNGVGDPLAEAFEQRHDISYMSRFNAELKERLHGKKKTR